MKTLTFECVKQILQHHHLSLTEQTGFFGGKLVDSGTSFAEEIGIKDSYSKKEIYDWLGY